MTYRVIFDAMVNIAKQKRLDGWSKALEIQPAGGGEKITIIITVEAYQGQLQVGVTTTDGPVPPNLVRWLDKDVELQPKDYKLFSRVWRSRNKRVRVMQAIKYVWGDDKPTEKALEQAVRRIRKKCNELEDFPFELSHKKDGSGKKFSGWLVLS